MRNPAPEPRSVLIYVGSDLVGDALMKLPFIRALRAAFPAAHIVWLAGKGKTIFASTLRPLVAGLLDEVIEEPAMGRGIGGMLRRPLAGRRFDLVIDTQRGVATTLLLRRIRHQKFVSGAADYLLSDVRPAKPTRKPPAMVGRLMELVALASGAPAEPGPTHPMPAELTALAARLLLPGPIYVGFAPGAGGRHKCWPRENFSALAASQMTKGRMAVFLLGPAETEWQAALEAAAPGAQFPLQDRAIPDGFKNSPLVTIALAGRLAAAVANDSGAGHMIAAADTPLISLFGPTEAAKFTPCVTRGRILRAQDFGATEMAAIPVAAVEAALEALLARA